MKPLAALLVALLTLAPSVARAAEDDDAPRANPEATEVQEPPSRGIPTQRYLYAASGVFLIGAVGFTYWGNGQALRAETITSAHEAREEFQSARAAAATANAMYVMAGLTLAYGLVLEFLPEKVKDKADLTFHF